MDDKQLDLLLAMAGGMLVLMERAITETAVDNALAAAMGAKPYGVQHQQLRAASTNVQDAITRLLAK